MHIDQQVIDLATGIQRRRDFTAHITGFAAGAAVLGGLNLAGVRGGRLYTVSRSASPRPAAWPAAATPMTRAAREADYAWSRWRRRHQARARWHHYHARLKAAARAP